MPAEWVGVVHAHPKTKEAFDSRTAKAKDRFERLRATGQLDIFSRAGTPNGFRGKYDRAVLARARERTRNKAAEAIAALERSGVLSGDDNRMAIAALATCAEIMLAEAVDPATGKRRKIHRTTHRIAAARILMEYTMAKPTRSTVALVSNPLAWLRPLAADAQSAR